jgi:hypothetical protein
MRRWTRLNNDGNVIHGDFRPATHQGDHDQPCCGDCGGSTGTDDRAGCEETVRLDPKRGQLRAAEAVQLEKRLRDVERRVDDAVLTVLQGQTGILRGQAGLLRAIADIGSALAEKDFKKRKRKSAALHALAQRESVHTVSRDACESVTMGMR